MTSSLTLCHWISFVETLETSFAPSSYQSTLPRTSTTNSLPRSYPAEILTIPVVKGPMGFGFTIADSPYGQKVKQILDAPRCTGLLEGDILMEINGRMIRSCTHNEAVNILKECPKGQQAHIVVQRGGRHCIFTKDHTHLCKGFHRNISYNGHCSEAATKFLVLVSVGNF